MHAQCRVVPRGQPRPLGAGGWQCRITMTHVWAFGSRHGPCGPERFPDTRPRLSDHPVKPRIAPIHTELAARPTVAGRLARGILAAVNPVTDITASIVPSARQNLPEGVPSWGGRSFSISSVASNGMPSSVFAHLTCRRLWLMRDGPRALPGG